MGILVRNDTSLWERHRCHRLASVRSMLGFPREIRIAPVTACMNWPASQPMRTKPKHGQRTNVSVTQRPQSEASSEDVNPRMSHFRHAPPKGQERVSNMARHIVAVSPKLRSSIRQDAHTTRLFFAALAVFRHNPLLACAAVGHGSDCTWRCPAGA